MELKSYTQKEVAKIVGYCRHTIANWTKKGKFPEPYLKQGREKKWTQDQLDEWFGRRKRSNKKS